MKAFLMATALIAAPAFAQSSTMTQPPAETTTTDTTTTETTTAETDTMTTAQPGSGMGAPGQPAPGSDAAMGANATAQGQMMTPPAPGGGNMVSQRPSAVDQTFPAPAPKADYPWCSRTVTDSCKQRVDPK